MVRAHQAMVWRYLRLLGADPGEADDLQQDTFVRFAAGQRRGEVVQAVPAFLRGIARNLLLGARRRARRQPPQVAFCEAVEALVAADAHAFDDRRIDALRRCLAALSPRARQALQWHHAEDLPRAAVAARLGIGDEGAKSLLARAREQVRGCVERRLTGSEP